MAIVFTRVDDRLIHGQIVQGWLPGMKVEEFVVVIETPDTLIKSLLRMALPSEYGLEVLPVEDAVEYAQNSDKKTFLLFSTVADVQKALSAGLNLSSINIGGTHYRQGREKILTDVYLDEQERNTVREFIKKGIEVDGRSVPKEAHINLGKILCS